MTIILVNFMAHFLHQNLAMRKFLLLTLTILISSSVKAQNLSFTCPKDTALGCSVNCFDLFVKFPDLRDIGDDYTLQSNPPIVQCFPIIPPASPGPSTSLIIDDRYSTVINLPFSFRFYGNTYNSLIVSTNGFVCFDVANTGLFSHYQDRGNLPSTQYDRALIMGPYHDLDPTPSIGTSPTQQIKYETWGVAPNRKWILSFYRVPLFSGACNNLIENTHQIILYETSNIVEVFIQDKQICPSWQAGKSMVGMQNWDRDKGIMAPGRFMTDPPWGSIGMNELWRFIPIGGAPLYRSVELLDATGATVAVGDTTRLDVNTFGWTFTNVCPPTTAPTLYVVKTTYAQLNNTSQTIYSLDTINVTRNAMPVTASSTSSACGINNGSITVTATGVAPPLTYTLNPGALSNSTGIFTGLAPGTYTITVTDASGTCTNTISATVDLLANLTGTFVRTNASCPGVSNGTITVTPTSGTGPYSYSANGGPSQSSGVFTNLSPGTYNIVFTDALGCAGSITATVSPGSNIAATATSTAASCPGASDGTITVTASTGVSPYTYSLNGGPAQTSNVFTGVPAGTHVITVIDSRGCTINVSRTVTAGAGLTGSIFQTAASCPGINDGTVTLTPTSGVAPYTYSMDGSPSQTSNVFTSVSPGLHTVTFTDALGCQGTRSINVGGGTAPATTATAANTSCAGASNGVIVIVPVAGSTYTAGPFTNTTGTFLGLPAGTYPLTISTSGGCAGTVTPSSVTIAPGAAVTTTASSSAASCPGVNNGSITVAPVGTGTTTYTINPGAISNTTGIFNGLAAGTYTVSFVTSAGCTGTVSPDVVVTASASPTSTATTSPATCPGASDGTVTVAPVGTGTTYTLNPGGLTNTTGIFTGLAAGTYTVTFVTAAGCNGTVTTNPVVTSGAAPTTTATSVASTCPSVNDGSITVAPMGAGTSYTLNPGAITNTTGVFTGLAAGTYTITFITSSGCNGTVPTNPVVTSGAAPTTTATSVATTCPSVNDGTINVAPMGAGTTYTLNPGAITNTTGVFTGLATGTYTVTFVTAAGCAGTVPTNPVVTSGPAPTSTATSVATTCPSVNDGSIAVAPVGTGTTYTLNPGAVTNTTGVFTGLAAGTYTVTFVTAAGCAGTVPTNPVVTSGAAPTSTATSVATTCPSVNDGSITVAPVGTGTTYTLNPGAVTNTTGVFTGLAAGTYTVTFVTAAGCAGTVPTNPVVTSGAAPTSTATSTATSCPGVNDGTITVAPVGTGTTYTLNPGAVSNSTGIFIGLAAGSYTITFVTGAGCAGTVPTNPVVTSGPAPTSTATATNTSCPSVNDGVVTVTPVGTGTTYTLNPGAVTNTTGIFTGLAAGTYTVTFVTAAGCNGTVPQNPVVTAGPFLTSTFTQVNPVCAGINNGSISITPAAPAAGPFTVTLTGPGGPYTVSASAPVVFNNLAPGVYNYSFTDAGGCTGTGGPVTLTSNPPIFTPAVVVNPSCNGGGNGSVTFSPIGGVAPYQYSNNAGATYQTSSAFTGLSATTYSFRIRDNVGCIKDTTITLIQPTVLINNISNSTPAGCSNNDGSISATASGATPTYTYTIAGPTVNTTGASSGVFTGLANGSYTITATDVQGCTASATGTVNLIDNMFLYVGNDTTICEESSITFQPQTNAQTNTFTWTGIYGTATSTIANPTIKNAVATPRDTATYVLHAVWGGCERRDTIIVNVLYKPVANAGRDTAICINTYAVLNGSSSHVSGTVNYEWTPSTNVAYPTQAVTNVNPAGSNITHTYTLTVRDEYGCNFAVTDQVNVTVQPPVPAFAGNDTTATLGVAHQLMASGGSSYLWSPSAPLNYNDIRNPLATLMEDQKFVVQVTDVAGCIGYDTVFVKVYAGPAYYIPNAFTPNGDGLNDIFRPIPVGMVKTDWFRVFNRFGETVFETTQWMKGWDGTFRGKKQPIGAYVWAIKGVDRNGKKIEMKGTVMLVQ
jgi:gliding motility-associated-like protein